MGCGAGTACQLASDAAAGEPGWPVPALGELGWEATPAAPAAPATPAAPAPEALMAKPIPSVVVGTLWVLAGGAFVGSRPLPVSPPPPPIAAATNALSSAPLLLRLLLTSSSAARATTASPPITQPTMTPVLLLLELVLEVLGALLVLFGVGSGLTMLLLGVTRAGGVKLATGGGDTEEGGQAG